MNVPTQGRDNRYWLVSGTSPACALTAGVAALIKSRYPGLTTAQVRRAITSTTRNRPRSGYDDQVPGPLPDFASRVLDVVDAIPPGRVMSYGDVAEYLEQGGPRQVGRVMSLWGGSAPWWRVVHADGSLVRGHEGAALERYRAEGTPLRPSPDGPPSRVDMRLARWSGEGTSPAQPPPGEDGQPARRRYVATLSARLGTNPRDTW